ncbi:ExeM/NucH family extracellular endonuclease [Azoarcus sp. L1K30]|uniref:ExeM/NucH family extracellular endonuclease n=1 Tax=Azoarcus sp. L1K30 TaxID=2820277 RepID=UPI001B824340|nr:ExeM/NucH family extracellular endonuclease [Azoarcus sp. L1K30]MBR0568216.1 ExeM/NucH family extracellular endonuclease [Azoarcus sp. L1K30]
MPRHSTQAKTVARALASIGFASLLFSPSAYAELFVSKYIEGSSNNKAIEIFNPDTAPVDLAAAGYAIKFYFNGSASPGRTIILSGLLAPGTTHTLVHGSAMAEMLALANQTDSGSWYNGDDAVVLTKDGAVVDAIGQTGFDPGSEWGTGAVTTANHTLSRKSSVTSGDTTPDDSFDPSTEWNGSAINDIAGLGSHTIDNGSVNDVAPSVSAFDAVGGAFEPKASLALTFSEPVSLSTAGISLTCSTSGATPVSLSGSGTQYTLDPVSDLVAGDSCTLTVAANAVNDLDGTPTAMASDFVASFNIADRCAQAFTPIYAIQGRGMASSVTGTVTTRGVVIGDYEGPSPALRGFYIQDPAGDGDPETSDGLFVFNGNNDSVALGQSVLVTGNVSEYQDQTQISASNIVTCGAGSVTPTDVTLPFPDANFPERFEGMLVRFPQALTVTEHYQLGRFGQVVVSAGDRLLQPTQVVRPGAEAAQLAEHNALNRLIVDDARNDQNPDPILLGRGGLPLSADNTLRGGDTATGMVGVMTYTWAGNSASGNAWRLRPFNALNASAPNFEASNARPEAVPTTGGSLRAASFNVLNYFVTLDEAKGSPLDNRCGPLVNMECRGADSAEELERQREKLVSALADLDADLVGLIELENTPNVDAAADIVAHLNQRLGSTQYAHIATGVIGGDAIRVGIIYKPARLAPAGVFKIIDAAVDPRFDTSRNRPSLAQTFDDRGTGARFTVVVNHLKSKGDSGLATEGVCADSDPGNDIADCDRGDGQGFWNASRTQAAEALADWLDTDPTGSGDPDFLLLGDFNAYSMEDPVQALESHGYLDLATLFEGPAAYSYVFDGQWGALDHAMASPSFVDQITGAAGYRINADEPAVIDYNVEYKSVMQQTELYAPTKARTSDHDPVVIGIDPY